MFVETLSSLTCQLGSQTELIIPPDYFYSSGKEFMGQDFLHGGKKLRNALRAGTARE